MVVAQLRLAGSDDVGQVGAPVVHPALGCQRLGSSAVSSDQSYFEYRSLSQRIITVSAVAAVTSAAGLKFPALSRFM